MKLLLKILLAPLMLVMLLVHLFLVFLISLSASLLSIFSGLLVVAGLIAMFFSAPYGLLFLVCAWLASPLGLPLFAGWFVGMLESLRLGIWDWICC